MNQVLWLAVSITWHRKSLIVSQKKLEETSQANEKGKNTYSLKGIVEIADVDPFTVQETLVRPAQLLGALLVDKQVRAELLGLDIEEACQLLQIHSRVQAEVRANSRVPHVGLDLVHEDGQVVLDGVNVGLGVLEIRGNGRDELGARSPEQLLEDGKRLGTTALQLEKLVAILLTESSVDGVVQTRGVERNTDGNECVHLVVLLGDRIVLGVLLEVLGSRDVDENVAEHADGIGVSVHHHVRETHVVVGGEVGSHDTGEHGLLVELNVVEGLEGEAEISKQTVDPEETNDGEVSQHLVEVLVTVLAGDGLGVLVALHGGQLLDNLRSLDQRVEHIEDTVATPRVGVLLENLALLLVVPWLAGQPHSVRRERVELVDELIDDIPSPVVLIKQQRISISRVSVGRELSGQRAGDSRTGARGRRDPPSSG